MRYQSPPPPDGKCAASRCADDATIGVTVNGKKYGHCDRHWKARCDEQDAAWDAAHPEQVKLRKHAVETQAPRAERKSRRKIVEVKLTRHHLRKSPTGRTPTAPAHQYPTPSKTPRTFVAKGTPIGADTARHEERTRMVQQALFPSYAAMVDSDAW